jgi:hypothetical protein
MQHYWKLEAFSSGVIVEIPQVERYRDMSKSIIVIANLDRIT